VFQCVQSNAFWQLSLASTGISTFMLNDDNDDDDGGGGGGDVDGDKDGCGHVIVTSSSARCQQRSDVKLCIINSVSSSSSIAAKTTDTT